MQPQSNTRFEKPSIRQLQRESIGKVFKASPEHFNDLKMLMNKEEGQLSSPDLITYQSASEQMLSFQHSGQRFAILAGGGLDSNFLIALAIKHSLDPIILSASTGKNTKHLETLKKVSRKYDFKHIIYTPSDSELEVQLSRFIQLEHRMPNDPVTPLVMHLCEKAKQEGAQIVMDGQFADTVLFANPQNFLLKILMSLPSLDLGFGSQFLHKISMRQAQVFGLIFTNIVEQLQFLSRVELTFAQKNQISVWIEHERINPQWILQGLFWTVLMPQRERDKYTCASLPIKSPFDRVDLLCSSMQQIRIENQSLFGYSRKKFLLSECSKVESLLAHTNHESFRLK